MLPESFASDEAALDSPVLSPEAADEVSPPLLPEHPAIAVISMAAAKTVQPNFFKFFNILAPSLINCNSFARQSLITGYFPEYLVKN
jgi:hypothetical protein